MNARTQIGTDDAVIPTFPLKLPSTWDELFFMACWESGLQPSSNQNRIEHILPGITQQLTSGY